MFLLVVVNGDIFARCFVSCGILGRPIVRPALLLNPSTVAMLSLYIVDGSKLRNIY